MSRMSEVAFYAVVEFPNDDNATAVISSTWLTQNDKFCFWPSGPNCNFSKLAKEHSVVKPKWQCYPCKVLKTTATFASAAAACVRSENRSCIDTTATETDGEAIRRRKSKKRTSSHRVKHPTLQLAPLVKSDNSSSSGQSSVSEINTTDCPTAGLLQNPANSLPAYATESTSKILPPPPATHPLQHVLSSLAALPSYSNTPPTSMPPIITDYSDSDSFRSPSTNRVIVQSSNSQVSSPQLPSTPTSCKSRLQSVPVQSSQSFEKVIVEYLVKILANQKEILRRLAEPSGKTSTPSQVPVFIPVISLETLEDLIQWLNVPTNLQALANELSIIGGENIAGITQRVLSGVLSNTVAESLSLTGRGKRTRAGIRGTSLHTLIYEAVRMTKGGGSATNNEIDKAIQGWLKSAPDREGGSQYQRHKRRRTCIEHEKDKELQNEQDGDEDQMK